MKRFAIANLPTGTFTNDKYTGEIAEITGNDNINYELTFSDGYSEWFPQKIVKEIDACTKCGEHPADVDDFGVCLCKQCLAADPIAQDFLRRQDREFNFRHYGNEEGED